jgi:hypothetical protein
MFRCCASFLRNRDAGLRRKKGKYGILRFCAGAKAHSLRRTSSSTKNRFARFSVDFWETRRCSAVVPPSSATAMLGCVGKRENTEFFASAQAQKLIRSVAPPLQRKTASLGFPLIFGKRGDVPLLRLLSPQPRCWVAEEMWKIKTPECFT